MYVGLAPTAIHVQSLLLPYTIPNKSIKKKKKSKKKTSKDKEQRALLDILERDKFRSVFNDIFYSPEGKKKKKKKNYHYTRQTSAYTVSIKAQRIERKKTKNLSLGNSSFFYPIE